MNESAIKRKIFTAKALDWFLFASVIGFAYWGVMYSGEPVIMSGIALAGLFIVSKIGNYTMTKVTILRQELTKLEREKKKEF